MSPTAHVNDRWHQGTQVSESFAFRRHCSRSVRQCNLQSALRRSESVQRPDTHTQVQVCKKNTSVTRGQRQRVTMREDSLQSSSNVPIKSPCVLRTQSLLEGLRKDIEVSSANVTATKVTKGFRLS